MKLEFLIVKVVRDILKVYIYNAIILKILTSLVFTVFWRPYVEYIVLTSVYFEKNIVIIKLQNRSVNSMVSSFDSSAELVE